jgi:hypothetical protein
MKNYITIISFLFFTAGFSQTPKFVDELDSLYLKNGSVKLGRVNPKKKYIEICKDKKNCLQFNFSEVDKITYGFYAKTLKENYKENQRRKKRKKEIIKLKHDPLYVLTVNNTIIYGKKRHSGNKYDFYVDTKTYFAGVNFDILKVKSIMRVTKKGERNVFLWMQLDFSNKKEFKRARKLIRKYTASDKCEAIENILNNYKAYERNPQMNLYEALDTCDLSVE